MTLKQTVLLFLINRDKEEIFFIRKKRGMGKGLWNGPGGKVLPDEAPLNALNREAIEETGLEALSPQLAGIVTFRFPEEVANQSFSNQCRIYKAFDWKGNHISESEECSSFWWPISKINFELFWPDDRLWMPLLLKGQYFEREYLFDSNNAIIEERILK